MSLNSIIAVLLMFLGALISLATHRNGLKEATNIFSFFFIGYVFMNGAMLIIAPCAAVLASYDKYDTFTPSPKNVNTIFIKSGLVILLGNLLVFLIYCIIFQFVGHGTRPQSIHFYYPFMPDQPGLAVLHYFWYSFLYAGVFSLFAYAVTQVTKNKYDGFWAALVASNIYSVIVNTIPQSIIDFAIPQFPYNNASIGIPIWKNYYDLGLITVVSVVLLIICKYINERKVVAK